MEHRLIQGGEQYLPFARSRVRALLALGLPYANQSFEIDGVSIKVRIEPGHEYIRIEGSMALYLESGQLEWTFPGPENPERLDTAQWHFLDTPPDGKFLGKVTWGAGDKLGKQVPGQNLAEGCDSRAIGYPYPKDATDEKKAEIQAQYEEAILGRKIVTGYFPASLWSGKMRLYMQALYGSEMSVKFPLLAELVGTEVVLQYNDQTSGESIQLGLWAHASPGILYFPRTETTSGGYWFINFTMSSANQFSVMAAPIVFSSAAAVALRVAHDDEQPEDVRHKAEAYAFASSRIDLKNKRVLGGFEARGGAMAYGWKFQADGHRASVVLNEVIGTGDHDYRWQATTIDCDFSATEENDYKNLDMAVSNTVHGTWTDGWGEYNIFVPSFEQYTAPLDHYSLKTNRPSVAPDFDFSNVSIYGYYDSSDVWIAVTLSRKFIDYSVSHKIIQSESDNVRYDPLLNMNQTWRIYQGMSLDPSFSYELHDVSSATTMTLSVGGVVYEGVSDYGSHSYQERTVIAGGTTQNNATVISNWIYPSFPVPPDAPALPTGDHTVGGSFMTTQFLQMTTMTFVGFQHHSWTLAIPGCDCSSVYVAKRIYDAMDGTPTKTIESFESPKSFQGTTVTGAGGAGMAYSITPYLPTYSHPRWYGINQVVVTTTEPGVPPVKGVNVFCHSTVLHGEEGVPGGSYEPLFYVDRNYPYYNRGMYTFTSAGGRYVMSEHAGSPPSVNHQNRFVGWA